MLDFGRHVLSTISTLTRLGWGKATSLMPHQRKGEKIKGAVETTEMAGGGGGGDVWTEMAKDFNVTEVHQLAMKNAALVVVGPDPSTTYLQMIEKEGARCDKMFDLEREVEKDGPSWLTAAGLGGLCLMVLWSITRDGAAGPQAGPQNDG